MEFKTRIEKFPTYNAVNLDIKEYNLYDGCGYCIAIIVNGYIKQIYTPVAIIPLRKDINSYIDNLYIELLNFLNQNSDKEMWFGICCAYQFSQPIKIDHTSNLSTILNCLVKESLDALCE